MAVTILEISVLVASSSDRLCRSRRMCNDDLLLAGESGSGDSGWHKRLIFGRQPVMI